MNAFFTILPITPDFMVVVQVSNPAEIVEVRMSLK